MIKETTVIFNGIEYKIKRSNRALMFWEDLTGKSFEDLKGTLTDMLKYFYSVLVVNNRNFDFTYEDFVDLTDDNQEAFEQFQSYLISFIM